MYKKRRDAPTLKHNRKQSVKKQATTRPPIDVSVVLKLEKIVRIIIPVLFFGFIFVFLQWYIDPAIIYSSNGIGIHNYVIAMHAIETTSAVSHPYSGPLFYPPFILEFSDSFAKEMLSPPGGFSRLLVAILIYLCHSSFIGALVLTAFSLLFFLIYIIYFKNNGTNSSYTLSCIPSFFLLTICAWYELDYLYFLIPVAGSLIFTILYQCFKKSGTILQLSAYTLFFWLAWYLFQWGSYLFFIFTIIYEVASGKTKKVPFLIASMVNPILLLALDLFLFSVNASIKWTQFTVQSGLPLMMILSLPFTAALTALWSRFRKGPQSNLQPVFRTLLDVSFLFSGLFTLVLWLLFEPVNRDTRTISRTCAHVMKGQWDNILKENTSKLFKGFPEKAGALQAFMIHSVAHALSATGQIGEKLFKYPQRVFTDDPLLFLESTNTNGYVNWFVVLDLAMDLGMVNTAEKIAGEIMENVGPLPEILYRRALIQIAKDNSEAASVFLRRLSHMPGYRNKSLSLLSILNDKDKLFSNPRIATMRTNMDTTDYYLYTINYDQILLNLLHSNPGNKTAFEYLMSYYLLTGQSDRVAEFLQNVSIVNYSVLPRLWEEGICVYQASNYDQGSSGSTLPSGLHQSTVNRFNEFARSCMTIGDDNTAAAKLAPLYGDSYFFYSIFRYSPGIQHE
jgi:hypothetical protein